MRAVSRGEAGIFLLVLSPSSFSIFPTFLCCGLFFCVCCVCRYFSFIHVMQPLSHRHSQTGKGRGRVRAGATSGLSQRGTRTDAFLPNTHFWCVGCALCVALVIFVRFVTLCLCVWLVRLCVCLFVFLFLALPHCRFPDLSVCLLYVHTARTCP